MSRYIAAIVFSAIPALVAFAALVWLGFGFILSVFIGTCVAGFGLDVCLRGSDRSPDQAKSAPATTEKED